MLGVAFAVRIIGAAALGFCCTGATCFTATGTIILAAGLTAGFGGTLFGGTVLTALAGAFLAAGTFFAAGFFVAFTGGFALALTTTFAGVFAFAFTTGFAAAFTIFFAGAFFAIDFTGGLANFFAGFATGFALFFAATVLFGAGFLTAFFVTLVATVLILVFPVELTLTGDLAFAAGFLVAALFLADFVTVAFIVPCPR